MQPINTQPSGQAQAALGGQFASLQDQRNQLLQMLSQANLLQPQMLAALGFGGGPDTMGQQFNDITRLSLEDLIGAAPEQKQINSLLRKRQIDALEGRLPVDPALERGLAEQEATLRNQLQAQLGSGYETSSAGIQALSDFRKRAEEARFSTREQVLGRSAGMSAMNTGQLFGGAQLGRGLQSSRFGDVFNTLNMTNPFITGLGQNAAGFGGSFQNFYAPTQLDVSSQLARDQARGALQRHIAPSGNAMLDFLGGGGFGGGPMAMGA
jgi:hypothetical protein